MALWKDTSTGTATPSAGSSPGFGGASAPAAQPEKSNVAPISAEIPRRPAKEQRLDMKESVIASDLTIEGKIIGSGHVRIAGRFKGDVHVDGNFRIDAGARLEGQVRAAVVVVGGELLGNIDAAKQVDVLSTGVIVGDVKAASITVAAGSRMRGHVEFGWDEKHTADKLLSLELKGTPRAI